jgi:hypothetical protein
MRTVLFGLAICFTSLATPAQEVEVVVPPSAFHPHWLRPQFRDNPNRDYRGKAARSLAEFVSPEVISKIVVDQYAGPDFDVRRYLTAMPTAAAGYFGPLLELCQWRRNTPDGPGFAAPGSTGPAHPRLLSQAAGAAAWRLLPLLCPTSQSRPTVSIRPKCLACPRIPPVSGSTKYPSIASM